MSILSYIKSIAPTFGSNEVKSKIRQVSGKINTLLFPLLTSFSEFFKDGHFTNPYTKAWMQAFEKSLPHSAQGKRSFIAWLELSTVNAQKIIEHLGSNLSKYTEETIHVEGISYRTANVLKLIELINFYTKYSIELLRVFSIAETNQGVYKRAWDHGLTKSEVSYILANQANFTKVMDLLQYPSTKIIDILGKVPSITVEDTPGVPAVFKGEGDPLNLGVIPLITPMFVSAAIRNANHELDEYNLLQRIVHDAEIRLEILRQGEMDARKETIIANYEREIKIMHTKLADAEARFR